MSIQSFTGYVQEKFVTPDVIWQFRHTIHRAPVLMVDANLNPQSLEAASKSMHHLFLFFFTL